MSLARARAQWAAVALCCAALLAPTSRLHAQSPERGGATVQGRAVAAADGGPVAFALVVLRDSLGGPPVRAVLTDAAGRFRIGDVAPGRYRLRLERIGLESTLTPELTLAAGETREVVIRSEPRPVEITGVTASVGCYTGDRLGEDPELATLWEEAWKGLETRRALERQLPYRYYLRQVTTTAWRSGDRVATARDTVVTRIERDPSVADAERRPRRGYLERRGDGWFMRVPSELELTADEFLDTHCLDSALRRVGGSWELRFRPVRASRGGVALRGALWIDAASYELQALELHYLGDGAEMLGVMLHYRDVELPGGRLRLPAEGSFQADEPTGRPGSRMSGTLEFLGYRFTAPS